MKKSLVFALALMLVLAFASSAMAAQVLSDGSYLSTTATGMSNTGSVPAGSIISRTYQINKFAADGITHYPYEIYLPNEKNPDQYRIHSNYVKNTDACASCHATHTAVGASLLQWYSVYETCMACHDGTLGTATYNVLNGKIGASATPAFGGMFGSGNGSESNHNVTGSMEIAAAPGGATVATEQVNGAHPGEYNTRWINEFGCESCHSPHGQGGNARILHPDANYAASWAAEARPVPNKYFINPANGKVYTDDVTFKNEAYIIKGYPYSPKIIDGNVQDATNMKIDNTSGTSIIREAGGAATVKNTVYVLGVASLKVKMTITNYLQATESVTHVYGMNFYCGACHTDYNTAAFTTSHSADSETGVYTQAHRHQMGMDWYSQTAGLKFETTKVKPYAIGSMECLTCHVAHGTSQDYWAATLGGTKGADGTTWALLGTDSSYAELAGSSALKRMPNMGTCEACHAKGDGSEGYNANAGIAAPSGNPAGSNGLMPNTYNYAARAWEYDVADLGWVGSAKCLGCHEEYVKGWKASGHATSSHTGAGSCGQCHDPGHALMAAYTGKNTPVDLTAADQASAEALLLNNPFSVADVNGTKYYGADIGITCESCHGSGKNHILAPSSTNIFNPGTTSVERQAMECGRCHDMYKNVLYAKNGSTLLKNYPDITANPVLSTLSGMASVAAGTYKMSAIVALPNFSVAYRVYDDAPTNFVDATQKTAVSTHFGGAWGYADSKHFLGTSTDASNPNGVVSCNTCHDMHSDKNAGLLKYEYQQICASCHDASANLAQAVAMPTNSWSRHQIEFVDYAHSFKFGTPASLTNATTVIPVNLEKGVLGTPGLSNAGKFYTVYDGAYGRPTVDWTAALKDRKNAFGDWNLWRGGNAGGGIGFKVTAANGSGRVYNNYEMTWEFVSTTATAVKDTDFVFEAGVGAIEFINPYGTATVSPQKDGAADYASNGAAYAKFAGVYTVKYTSKVNPAVTGTVSFTVVDGTPFGTGSYTQP